MMGGELTFRFSMYCTSDLLKYLNCIYNFKYTTVCITEISIDCSLAPFTLVISTCFE